jgi:hypothetical protein
VIPFGLLAKVGGVIALLLAVQYVLHAERQKGIAACQASYAAAALRAQQEDARTLILKHERNQEIANGLRQKAQREAATAADLRGQLDRMRSHAAAAARGAAAAASAPGGGTDEAGRLRSLLAEGAQRVVALGSLAEEGRGRIVGLAAQVTGLQSYEATVCQP